MARASLLAVAFSLLAVPLSSGMADPLVERTGPYHGVVTEGQTDLHLYATGPRNCLVPPRYFVTLDHSPVEDVLVLQAAGQSAASTGGRAVVAFDGDCSAQFLVTVSGAVVETASVYRVTVTTGIASWYASA